MFVIDEESRRLPRVSSQATETTEMKQHHAGSPASQRANPSPADEPITIRVRDQTGEETFFKLKMDTSMGKVFNTYAARKEASRTQLIFRLDGERIADDASPRSLKLGEQDQIDCICWKKPNRNPTGEPITIRVRDQMGEETLFRVKMDTLMVKVFDTYAARKKISRAQLSFCLDGQRIADEATPRSLDLDDQDRLDCIFEQTGC